MIFFPLVNPLITFVHVVSVPCCEVLPCIHVTKSKPCFHSAFFFLLLLIFRSVMMDRHISPNQMYTCILPLLNAQLNHSYSPICTLRIHTVQYKWYNFYSTRSQESRVWNLYLSVYGKIKNASYSIKQESLIYSRA